MADLSVSNTFVSVQVIDAPLFNTNYSDVVTYINNRNSGSATWDSFYISTSSGVPLTVNNSTGVQDIVQFKDNGTTVMSINDGGFVNFQYQDFVYATADGQFSTGAPVKINMTAVSQTHSNFSSSRFTCSSSAAGKYMAVALGNIAEGTIGAATVEIHVYKNGSLYSKKISKTLNAGNNADVRLLDILSLVGNDYIEFYVRHSGGVGGVNSGKFYIYKIT